MSADYTTEITMNGNREELTTILKIAKSYCTDKKAQYEASRNCAYLLGAKINFLSKNTVTNDSDYYSNVISNWISDGADSFAHGNSESMLYEKKLGTYLDKINQDSWMSLESMSDEEIEALPISVDDTLYIDAQGPYGVFHWLEEVNLFFDIADAAPSATFSGSMWGSGNDGDQHVTAELKNGLLYLDTDYSGYDDEDGYNDEDEQKEEDEYDEQETYDEDIDVEQEGISYGTIYNPKSRTFLLRNSRSDTYGSYDARMDESNDAEDDIELSPEFHEKATQLKSSVELVETIGSRLDNIFEEVGFQKYFVFDLQKLIVYLCSKGKFNSRSEELVSMILGEGEIDTSIRKVFYEDLLGVPVSFNMLAPLVAAEALTNFEQFPGALYVVHRDLGSFIVDLMEEPRLKSRMLLEQYLASIREFMDQNEMDYED